jgi:hypothetical protein
MVGVSRAARLRFARAAAGAGLVVCLLGTMMPWLRSGQRRRSSYQLAGLAGRLLDGPTHAIAHLWLAYPLVATAALALLLVLRGRLPVVGCAVAGVLAAAFAALASHVPLPGLFGLWVTWGGAATATGALLLMPRRHVADDQSVPVGSGPLTLETP